MSNTTKDMTVGSPLKLILGFSVPLLFGMLFQQFYSLIDTAIVGKFLGVNALSGVGATGSVNFLVIGFCNGVCSGFSIPVARQFGAKKEQELRRYVGNSMWLSIIFAALMTVFVSIFCSNILKLMNTPKDFFEYSYTYILIIFLGIPATYLYNLLSGMIRALGDSKTPLIFLIISSLLNIALDLFLILVIPLGVAGAALATVISQLVSGVLCLFYIKAKFPILHLNKDDFKMRSYYMKRLCADGIPMGLQYSITAIGSVILQTSVNGLGTNIVAAVTAAGKINMFFACPFDALGSTMATYGGQNVGAGKYDRLGKGMRDALVIGCVYSVFAFLFLQFFTPTLALLFLDAKETVIISYMKRFLTYATLFFPALAAVNIIRFLIQGMGFSKFAILSGVFEMVARTAMGLFLVPAFGFQAVCFAHPSAWIAADIFLVPAFLLCRNWLVKAMGQSK